VLELAGGSCTLMAGPALRAITGTAHAHAHDVQGSTGFIASVLTQGPEDPGPRGA
jgi:hypothetical protein